MPQLRMPLLTLFPSAPLGASELDGIVDEAIKRLTKEKETYEQSLERAKQTLQPFASNSTSSKPRYGGPDGTRSFEVDRLACLGRGADGYVYKVQTITGELVACKEIATVGHPDDVSRLVTRIKNEVAIMKRLRHHHISVVLVHEPQAEYHKIFMEPVADYNLRCYLDNCAERAFPESAVNQITPWFGCLVDALGFAHQNKIAHRDIKPANILIKDMKIYLADFGVAKDFTEHEMIGTVNTEVCCTPVYRAPEVGSRTPRGLPADVFSLGCVFSEMLTIMSGQSLLAYQNHRRVPGNVENPLAFRLSLKKVREWLGKCEIDTRAETLSSEIIKPMIREDPRERKTAQQLWKQLAGMNSNEHGWKFFCDFHYT